MKKAVLYLGDTCLNGAAAYLAGVLEHYHIGFDYLASDEGFCDSLLDSDYSAVVLSDYPASNFLSGQLEALARQVNAGLGLVMIGGWESFSGTACHYTNTIMRDVLPVLMEFGDDRVNCYQPCLIEKMASHPIVDGLPFEQNSVGIGGFNRLRVKPDSVTLLSARKFCVSSQRNDFSFTPEKSFPLLVVGNYGKGRVGAFASDVAPHWVGGLVDWGDSRVMAQAPQAGAIEVGNWYAMFFANIVKWAINQI